MLRRVFPALCPSCSKSLSARRFECAECGTAVEGEFALPPLLRLAPEDQEFVSSFIKCGGALKDLARVYGVSYPTVRNRLDALIERLKTLETDVPEQLEEEQEK